MTLNIRSMSALGHFSVHLDSMSLTESNRSTYTQTFHKIRPDLKEVKNMVTVNKSSENITHDINI